MLYFYWAHSSRDTGSGHKLGEGILTVQSRKAAGTGAFSLKRAWA